MRQANRQRVILALLLISLIFTTGCVLDARGRSAKRMPTGCAEYSLVHDGLTRWYRICIPDPLPESAPVVLYLHGGTLSMRAIFSPRADSTATWFQIADQEGLILLIPNGVNPETGDTYGDDQNWNDLRPDKAAGQTRADDVGFLLTLLEQVSDKLPVDQERIFVTGASNGGMMTYRMLIEAPERFAAGAAFIANLPDLPEPLPTPDKPVPIMIANGTEDPLVPWTGGVVGKDRGQVLSTLETVNWWIAVNRGDPDQMVSADLDDLNPEDGCQIHQEIIPGREDGADVWFYEIEGGGHTLPSLNDPVLFQGLISRVLGPICRDADGFELAWKFFQNVSGEPDSTSP